MKVKPWVGKMRAKCVFFTLRFGGMNVTGAIRALTESVLAFWYWDLSVTPAEAWFLKNLSLGQAKQSKLCKTDSWTGWKVLFTEFVSEPVSDMSYFVFFVFLSSSLYCCLTLGFLSQLSTPLLTGNWHICSLLMSVELITLNQTNLATRNNLWPSTTWTGPTAMHIIVVFPQRGLKWGSQALRALLFFPFWLQQS